MAACTPSTSDGASKPKVGPMPTGRRWKGLPVPFFFQAATAEAFLDLNMREDDVVLSSLPKAGTTWVHQILHLLLHGVDTDGSHVEAASDLIGSKGQVYPEAILKAKGALPDPENPPHMQQVREKLFGTWSFEDDLCAQASPRLFSTHLYGQHLPAMLRATGGKGRLIIVLRNLKDTMSSLHFFQGEAKDGWLGNEHGPGSLARFIHPDSPNAYGSCFQFVRQSDDLATSGSMHAEGRVLVVYYEDLIRSLPAQVERIASFLRVPLSEAKHAAVVKAVSFDAMKRTAGSVAALTLRKGGIGDWRNHLSAEDWRRFDAAFDAALDGVALAEPLRYYQMMAVDGLPPHRAAQAVDCDPRAWPTFVRKTLVDGRVVRDGLIASSNTDSRGFVRPPSEYCAEVLPPGSAGAKHVAEAGRYHLFVSGVCPWASGVRAVRHLLGLDEVISMDVADGQSGAGWVLLHGTSCPPWEATGAKGEPFFLHEAYQASDPLGSTRITVPVLWDKKLRVIVSNDSWAIIKMMSTAFSSLGAPKPARYGTGCASGCQTGGAPGDVRLLPPEIASKIEAEHARLYSSLLNGVYKAGVALVMGKSDVHEEAASEVYKTLDELDATLSQQRFLLNAPSPTALDVRVLMTLLRFDISYMHAFGLKRGGKGGILVDDATKMTKASSTNLGYPHIAAYVRELYGYIAPTVDWAAFPQYYRWTKAHPSDAPLPSVTAVMASAQQPHRRDDLPVVN